MLRFHCFNKKKEKKNVEIDGQYIRTSSNKWSNIDTTSSHLRFKNVLTFACYLLSSFSLEKYFAKIFMRPKKTWKQYMWHSKNVEKFANERKQSLLTTRWWTTSFEHNLHINLLRRKKIQLITIQVRNRIGGNRLFTSRITVWRSLTSLCRKCKKNEQIIQKREKRVNSCRFGSLSSS